ncbi:response regulator transcription factor [Romboutsia sp. 1001713B170131_170501_G6]|uniref:response regulator transcription factor n=1 Tax=Romboutsia sp. 1001713B170131_170501_G6 TaxID=2787108 RepID=UPI0018ABC663|nr:response regulator transcription factor [Romboutsia sp. 1001713B170131_170501_G6]
MSKKLILICDDQETIHETIGQYLKSEGMDYISAYDGLDGVEKANRYNPDLILLDLMMPKMFGTDVCKEIRKNSNVPIIMLTAKGETVDRIIGLEIGADDYITKPFSPREVVTRIKTVLRRSGNNDISKHKNVIVQGNLKIDIESHEVYIDGNLVSITPKEMKTFYMLASNSGKTLTREYILSEVWGYDYFGDTRVVDTQIKRLRKKISQFEVDWEIKSIYGVGYKFEVI